MRKIRGMRPFEDTNTLTTPPLRYQPFGGGGDFSILLREKENPPVAVFWGLRRCLFPQWQLRKGLYLGYGRCAQRDSSLWNPIVGAIAIGLVRQTACRCFGWYLLVLRERWEGWFLLLFWKRRHRPLAIRPGKAGQRRSLPGWGKAALGGQKRRQINCRRLNFPQTLWGTEIPPGAVCVPESLFSCCFPKKRHCSRKKGPTGRRGNSSHLSPFFSEPGFSFIYPKGLTAFRGVFAACPQQMERSHQRQDFFPYQYAKSPRWITPSGAFYQQSVTLSWFGCKLFLRSAQ